MTKLRWTQQRLPSQSPESWEIINPWLLSFSYFHILPIKSCRFYLQIYAVYDHFSLVSSLSYWSKFPSSLAWIINWSPNKSSWRTKLFSILIVVMDTWLWTSHVIHDAVNNSGGCKTLMSRHCMTQFKRIDFTLNYKSIILTFENIKPPKLSGHFQSTMNPC